MIILGENELEQGELMIKEMKTGKEYKVCIEDASAYAKNLDFSLSN